MAETTPSIHEVHEKDRAIIKRWVRDINEHYKAHQQGTWMTIFVTLFVPVLLALLKVPTQANVWFSTAFMIAVASCLAWHSASEKCAALEAKLAPQLSLFFNLENEGCVRPVGVDDLYFRLFRIGVKTIGAIQVEGCQGFLTNVEIDGKTTLQGEDVLLTFAPAEDSDSTNKTIWPGKDSFLDLLSITPSGVHDIRRSGGWHTGLPAVSEIFPRLGDYFLTVKVYGKTGSVSEGRMKLHLTANAQLTTLEKLVMLPSSTPGTEGFQP